MFKILSIFVEEELDELVKSRSTFDFADPKGAEENFLPKFKHGSYTNVNYTQLKTFLGDTKLKVKLKQIGKSLIVPSTSGYNDFYLNFLQDSFNIQIKKSPYFFTYAILAIEFLNNNTSDCFFDMPGQDINIIGCVGKSKYSYNT